MKPKLLVCDDDEKTAKDWAAELRRIPIVENAFDVENLSFADFESAVAELEKRRRYARERAAGAVGEFTGQPWGEHVFDKAAMIVVDYDLLKLEADSYLTGENVAYLARCYSRCGTIVALNQFGGDNSFDLTLKGHVESYADLNIGGGQLDSVGLWAAEHVPFRPWSWPRLLDEPAALERRIADLAGHLDDSILNFLGLSQEVLNLSRSVLAFLSPEEDSLVEVDFKAFVASSGQGFRRKDEAFNDESLLRISAARISAWLEQAVLPTQDTLIDAPHLAARCPSLIVPEISASTLARLTDLGEAALPIDFARIDEWKFRKTGWLSRHAWFWNDIRDKSDLPELIAPWENPPPELVFREDSSDLATAENSTQFIADLASPNVRRYVSKPQVAGVDYRPKVRFTL